jgi:integrase
MDLKNKLKELRPNASAATIRTYNSLLKNMFYKSHSKEEPIDIAWFKNSAEVLESLKDKTPQSRKTNLAAVIVLLDGKDSEKYAEMMNTDADYTAAEYKKQEKTDKQKENWIDYAEVKAVWDKQFIRANKLLGSKDDITAPEMVELVKFMALTLASGIFFPPRRSEWVSMKIKDFDPAKDNYIDTKKQEFVFNSYKTHKTLGQERVPYPKQFKLMLNRYLKKVGDREYLIFNTRGGQLSNAALTQMLNAAFGKKIGTSMLRHIFLSDKFKDIPKLTDLQATADSLGHSVGQMLEYIKH